MADTNIQQINSIINNLKNKFTPSKTLMTDIAEEMIASVQHNFDKSNPMNWAPLKPATIKARNKKGLTDGILKATGMLFRSIQSSATDNSSSVHTNLRYAAIHHYGGVISIAARTRTLFHRTDAKGNLLKQNDNKNLLVFAKESHKRKAAYTFGQKNYNITIPPRPFMVLTDTYTNNIINKIRAHVLTANG